MAFEKFFLKFFFFCEIIHWRQSQKYRNFLGLCNIYQHQSWKYLYELFTDTWVENIRMNYSLTPKSGTWWEE
jgi:hypothetical protein